MITPERLRERLRPPKKTPKSIDWSKWIGSPVAWLALLLSSLTAYTTYFRKADDVRVIIDTFPYLAIRTATRRHADQLYSALVPHDFVFINSGNREAIILDIMLHIWFAPVREKVSQDCRRPPTLEFKLRYEFSPLVIKPGEMIPRPMLKIEDGAYGAGGAPPSVVNFAVKKGEVTELEMSPLPTTDDMMFACISFTVALPDSESTTASLLLVASDLTKSDETIESQYPNKRTLIPRVLVKTSM
jgi:hypothetical protein